MQVSNTFKVQAKIRTTTEALALADDIERAVGDLMTGKLKPGKLDVELLTGAVQALRDHVPAASNDEIRKRCEFYEAAMKDKKNHAAMALELAFLRDKVDSLTIKG